MKKKLIAALLCLVTLLTIAAPAVFASGENGVEVVYADGSKIDEDMGVIVPKNEKVAVKAVSSVSGSFQWQIGVSSEVWANIIGENEAEITLSYAMLINMGSTVGIRCKVTPAEGDPIYSDVVYVTLGEATVMVLPYAEPTPTPVVKPGSVVVHDTSKKSEEAPKTEAPKAEAETPAEPTPEVQEPEEPAEAPKAEEPEVTPEPKEEPKAEDEGVMPLAEGDEEAPAIEEPKAEATEEPKKARDGEGDVKKTYNIVINYVFENNEIVSDPYTATLAEGSSFSASVTFPTVQGYLPYVGETQQNTIELNYTSVIEDVTINVVYKPTNVDYTVIHYQQNVDNDQYTVKETETKQGLTASQVPEVHKTYEGYYNLLYERPNIAADGSTVIEIYYDRYYYLMNFDMDGGYGTEPVYARYGANIGEVNTPTKAGYSFGGWSETEGGTTAVELPKTMPAANKTYYAIWEPDATAKVTVVFWGENADDEGYSYLADQTKVINLKPGREFTYSESEMLVCDKEVHTHTDACLNCGKTEHTHSALGGSCYTLTCTVETHTHGTGCYAGVGNRQNVYTGLPDNPQEGQVYGHWLYGNLIYIKGTWYNYTGSTASGSIAPTTCDKEESTHTHNNDCYALTCTTEEHTHGKNCYTCGKEAHTHNPDCYMQGAGLDSTLWKFVKSDTITVAADGSSVVNVYYDRVEYSVQFYENQSCSSNREYTSLKITAKWGQNILSKWPTYDGSSSWYVKDKSNTWQNSIQVMPVGGAKFWGPKSGSSKYTATYYVEILDGEKYDVQGSDGRYYKVHHTDTSNSSGNVTDEERYGIDGFTINNSISTSNGTTYGGSKFYYTRNSYKLTFNDQYNDVKNESVKYEAPLSTYKDYEPEVPSAYEPGSVEFGGWYQNPQCTGEEYKLDEHTMPSTDIILYAKWVPVTRTVKFYLTESSTEVYKPATAEIEASFTIPHGDNIAEEYVKNNLTVEAMNKAKPNGDYSFVMWYYCENGEKKPFDPTMQIRKDLNLYGEWSSNTLKEYTVQYVLKSDNSVKVADDLTGSGLAGTTKTFDAKGGTDLYADYQEGYFPTVQSQSLVLDIDKETLTITFEYVPMPAVPYTVKYVEKDTGKSLADDKVVSDNRKAVVTETFEPITGYMPDAYQKRLVVTADGENILYFYYTKDTEHAYYKITHYTQNTDGETWSEYASSQAIGDIGTRYTASPMTIPGYTYKETKYMVNGTEVTDVTAEGAKLTENGLEINLYYVRNEYPYQVRYLEQGSGNVLHDPKNGTGKYGEMISESAIDIDGYDKVDPTSATLNIRIDEGEGAPNLNIITFYYKEKEVTINYVVVGEGGSVNLAQETLHVFKGVAQGSTASANDGYTFDGWYSDEACTTKLSGDAKYVPDKTKNYGTADEPNMGYEAATYYAKFTENEVTINYVAVGPDGATNFGSVNPTTETVKVKSGTAQGSTPAAGDGFKFVGWYKDEACTEAVDASWVTDNKIVPQKTDGKNVAATYYAKFEYDITSLTIRKVASSVFDTNDKFVFTVKGENLPAEGLKVVLGAGESATIPGLKVGSTYTVTEDGGWSWRYTASSTTNPITLTANAEDNVVTFTNAVKLHKWLSGSSWAKNWWGASKAEKSE